MNLVRLVKVSKNLIFSILSLPLVLLLLVVLLPFYILSLLLSKSNIHSTWGGDVINEDEMKKREKMFFNSINQ